MRKKNYRREGFSLIELLVSTAVFTIITLAAFPAYDYFSKLNTLNEGVSIIVSAISRTELISRASLQNTGWGISLQSSSIVIFNGASLASSTPSLLEVFPLPSGITISGPTIFVFSKFYGLPTATGTIRVSVAGGKPYNITINSQGSETYQY
jgi:prepilin-type N-terminal cleavage/methylation domain-containing protein